MEADEETVEVTPADVAADDAAETLVDAAEDVAPEESVRDGIEISDGTIDTCGMEINEIGGM